VQFSFTFDEAAGEVTILLEGDPAAGEFRALAERLAADPRYRSGLAHLVDCSRLHAGTHSLDAIQEEMAPLVERDWHFPPRAVAIVAPDPEVYARAVLARARRACTRAHGRLDDEPQGLRGCHRSAPLAGDAGSALGGRLEGEFAHAVRLVCLDGEEHLEVPSAS